MNKIEKLLKELCPNGVKFKALGEIFEIKNGYTPSKANKEFWEGGTIPWFRMDDIRTNGRILSDSLQHITPKALKGGKLFPKNSIIISTTATIGEHALIIVDSLANQRFTFLSKKVNCDIAIDMKFIYYYCFILGQWCKQNTNVSGFASVDMKAFKNFQIPIPPLEVQEEIVKILDTFTELKRKLEEELERELESHIKQYEYYRNKLLSLEYLESSGGYELKTLGEICEARRGSFPQPYGDTRWYGGIESMPFVQTADIGKNMQLSNYTKSTISKIAQPKSIFCPKNSVIVSLQGVQLGRVAITQYDCYIDRTIAVFQNYKIDINKKYFAYQLYNAFQFKRSKARGATIPTITKEEFKAFQIPIPPLEVQEKIVSILDKFHALTTGSHKWNPSRIRS
ncbi:restriction endonuclease subunit S [Helicobacter trogontum]|uniref:restriction endonuclease subunit S n=1 Tax=Helicobacter trogontum TaxID=50960 RepID=UPI0009E058E3